MNITLDLSISTPRLFAAGYYADAQAHQATFGPMPESNSSTILQEVDAAGLDGRGGAGFALFRKLASTERGKNALVIANAAEGEYLSYKDRMLLEHAPHLVLDGLQIAGALVGSGNLYLYARDESLTRIGQLAQARGINLVSAPGTFVSGEASSAAKAVLTGLAKPMNHGLHLNRSEKTEQSLFAKSRGPVLVQNVETLAHLALVARYGASWFRSTGGVGTRLFTLHRRDGISQDSAVVLELPDGITLTEVAEKAGVSLAEAPAVLIGGLQGRWAQPADYQQPLAQGHLNPAAGIIYPLSAGECPLTVSAQFINYLAAENAGQCGPCVNGLPELAQTFSQVATAVYPRPDKVQAEIGRLAQLVTGRGMCKHPDATASFAYRSLELFAEESHRHSQGVCSRKALFAA